MAGTLIELARIYQEEGRNDPAKYSESEVLYERAVEIERMNAGNDSPQMLSVLMFYGGLLREMHQEAKAAEVQAHINAIQKETGRPKIN